MSESVVKCVCVFTVSTVQLDGVSRQLDGDAVLAALWKLKILHLAVGAQHVHVENYVERWTALSV